MDIISSADNKGGGGGKRRWWGEEEGGEGRGEKGRRRREKEGGGEPRRPPHRSTSEGSHIPEVITAPASMTQMCSADPGTGWYRGTLSPREEISHTHTHTQELTTKGRMLGAAVGAQRGFPECPTCLRSVAKPRCSCADR